MASKIRIAVLMGGESPEHEISLRSGRHVLAGLEVGRYEPLGVVINRKGEWAFAEPDKPEPSPELMEGFLSPGRAIDMLRMMRVDIVFIALHGPYGEDGTVQGLLELHHIAYVGSRVAASALAIDKVRARAVLRERGIEVPAGASVTRREWQREGARWLVGNVEGRIRPPWFVKPSALGSSVGVSRARDLGELEAAVGEALGFGETALVEESCEGVEVTCGVLGNGDGELQALPPVEIVPQRDGFFTYLEKYDPRGAKELCPPQSLDASAVRRVQSIAERAHRALGCDGMSRVDMISGKDSIRVLELNTIPGLTERSLLPQAAAAAGISFPALLDRLVSLGMQRFGKHVWDGSV